MATITPWNEKSEAKLAELYKGKVDSTAERLKELGKQFDGRNERQMRCKLVSMKIYEPLDTPATSGSGSTERKADIRRALETLLSVKRDSLTSLDKGSKAELLAAVEALKAKNDKINADNGIKEPQA